MTGIFTASASSLNDFQSAVAKEAGEKSGGKRESERGCISGGVMYLVFTRMPDESFRRRLRSLLYLCYVFPALINSLVR